MQPNSHIAGKQDVTGVDQPISPVMGEIERLRLPLKGGRTVRLIFSGSTPTQEDISKIIALLELTKDTFPIAEVDGEEIDGKI